MSSTILRVFFSIILSVLMVQTPSKGFSSDNFPQVLSCVKGKSDDFTLHLVTLIEQNEKGTGEAFVDDRLFKLVQEDGIWLGTSKKGTEFLILEDDKIKIISGKTNWEGLCFRSDDALAPLVKTVSQPLSIKIENLTKELHKLKSELALIEIENSKLIEKIEENKLSTAISFSREVSKTIQNIYHHIGVYIYNVAYLKKFVQLKIF
mgnify:CR=1 FL=1